MPVGDTLRGATSVSQLYCGGLEIPTVTISSTGLLNVSSISANLTAVANYTSPVVTYVIPALVDYQLTANVYYYVVAAYNSGNPVYQVITDNTVIDHATIIAVCQPFWENIGGINEGHIFAVGVYGLGLPNKIAHRLIHTERFGWESGLSLSEAATRKIMISAGVLWYDGQAIALGSFDSAVNLCHLYYHSAGVFTAVDITQYNNTQYDNGTNLATLGNNHYGVNWIYRNVADNDVMAVLGTSSYDKLLDANASQPPTLPTIIAKQCVLVGRIIVHKGIDTAAQIDSAFAVKFSASPLVNHPDLNGRTLADQHPATAITNTPSGNITAVTVQAALNEIDTRIASALSYAWGFTA